MTNRRFLSLLQAIVLFAPLAISPLRASSLSNEATWKDKVEPLLVQYCFECHDSLTADGDFDLEALPADFMDSQAAGHWIEVMDNVNASEMPPEDEPQPSAEERALIAEWIAAELEHVRLQAAATGGRVLLRRLTRAEYENTVRDLLGVAFEPKRRPTDLLPPDGSIEGFNKVSKGLLLDPSLMDQYLNVAKMVADLAIQPGDPPVPTIRQRVEYEEYDTGLIRRGESMNRTKSVSPDGTGIISWSQGFRTFAQLRHPYNDQMVPVSGTYAIRFRAAADPGDSGKPVLFEVTRSGEGKLFYGELDAPFDAPKVYEVVHELDAAGGGELGLRMVEPGNYHTTNRFYHDLDRRAGELTREGKHREGGHLKARIRAEGILGMSRPDPAKRVVGNVPKVYLDWVEIEGPIYEQWPPESMNILFPNGFEEQTEATLQDLVARLLPRAYRRPVTQEEIDLVHAVAMAEWDASGDYFTGVRAALVTMLCSPSFLYLHEPEKGEEKPWLLTLFTGKDDGRRDLNDYELASRLSYFLWSTMPDDELTALAAEGKLRDQLDAQISRMLNDPRSEALVTGFATQWLRADQFDRFTPDSGVYRDFYANEFNGINNDLNREPLEFFRHILRSGGDLRDFLDADWTMANKRLAKWYGLPDGAAASNDEFVPVSLPTDSPRGGLVGMGALHKWGSDGNRTRPVDRGVYVLEVLFNDPPNPPPPNVGEVEPNVGGKKMTVRERLEAHREIESCANCHSRLDPYGLALENFNVVGRWRDYQDGENQHWGQSEETRIDVSGKLPNGTAFQDLFEFKAALRSMDDRFLRGFSEKLFKYSLGRIPEPVDRGLIDQMVSDMKENGAAVESAIRTIVSSEAFLTK